MSDVDHSDQKISQMQPNTTPKIGAALPRHPIGSKSVIVSLFNSFNAEKVRASSLNSLVRRNAYVM